MKGRLKNGALGLNPNLSKVLLERETTRGGDTISLVDGDGGGQTGEEEEDVEEEGGDEVDELL